MNAFLSLGRIHLWSTEKVLSSHRERKRSSQTYGHYLERTLSGNRMNHSIIFILNFSFLILALWQSSHSLHRHSMFQRHQRYFSKVMSIVFVIISLGIILIRASSKICSNALLRSFSMLQRPKMASLKKMYSISSILSENQKIFFEISWMRKKLKIPQKSQKKM